jgi:hypothetical protein
MRHLFPFLAPLAVRERPLLGRKQVRIVDTGAFA